MFVIELIQNHDFIFWCGDFNYRVELERNVVDEAIKNKNWIVSKLNSITIIIIFIVFTTS